MLNLKNTVKETHKMYSVMYQDYAGRMHLHFCKDIREVNILKMNYDVTEIQSIDSDFAAPTTLFA